MKKLFYVKAYADNVFYCYHCDWTIKMVKIFGVKLMWIHTFGFSISAFYDKKEAETFIKSKKIEYVNAQRYIKL